MKINQISTQNNSNKPAFRGVDTFSQIKNIPGMICAVCGKPTINMDVFVKTVTPLSKSLTYNMEKGVLNFLQRRFPLVWEKLVDFRDRFPNSSLDEILEDNDGTYTELKQSVVRTLETTPVPHQTPERIELDRQISNLFFNTIDVARSYMKSSSIVMKQLMGLKGYLSGIKKEVFEQFEIYSRKYPDKSLSEIVNLPEIHKFHCSKNFLQRIETREKLDYHFENIRNLVAEKNPKAVEYFDKLKENTLEMYETENDEAARVYKTINAYKIALKGFGCEDLEEQVLAELQEVPRTFLTKDSFFDYAHNHEYTDGKIISSLFGRLFASEEHIDAVSQGGEDKVENKIVMHRACNDFRKSLPYPEFIKYHPDMPKHTQTQMNLVTDQLLAGNLPDALRFYPIKATEKLYNSSNGLIDLDIKEYCTKGFEQSEARVEANEDSIGSLQEVRRNINQQIDDLIDNNRRERNLQSRMQNYLDSHK